jgi:hypothetical protein
VLGSVSVEVERVERGVEAIVIDGVSIVGFRFDEGQCLLQMKLFDKDDQEVLTVVDNELTYFVDTPDTWDFEFVSGKLTVRSGPREILVVIQFKPPNALVIPRETFFTMVSRFRFGRTELLSSTGPICSPVLALHFASSGTRTARQFFSDLGTFRRTASWRTAGRTFPGADSTAKPTSLTYEQGAGSRKPCSAPPPLRKTTPSTKRDVGGNRPVRTQYPAEFSATFGDQRDQRADQPVLWQSTHLDPANA